MCVCVFVVSNGPQVESSWHLKLDDDDRLCSMKMNAKHSTNVWTTRKKKKTLSMTLMCLGVRQWESYIFSVACFIGYDRVVSTQCKAYIYILHVFAFWHITNVTTRIWYFLATPENKCSWMWPYIDFTLHNTYSYYIRIQWAHFVFCSC